MTEMYKDVVWESLIEQCKNGNVQAMKLFFEMMKEKDDEKTDKRVVIIDDISRTNSRERKTRGKKIEQK